MSGAPAMPGWMQSIASVLPDVRADQLSTFVPPASGGRRSAVLMLFGETSERGPDVLLTQRAAGMRSHAGQVAFPGGAVDRADPGPVEAALREAREETGLDPGGVRVVGALPDLYLPPSDFVVTPAVAWWASPSEVAVADPAEVARVARVPLDELLDPRNRFRVSHPSGYIGPGFAAQGLFVWGFTAGLLARLLQLAGLERPWDHSRIEPVPDLVPDLPYDQPATTAKPAS